MAKGFIVVLLVILVAWIYVGEIDRRKGKVRMSVVEYYEYWAMLAPLNVWEGYHSAKPEYAAPFVPLEAFPGHVALEQNWQVIRDEAISAMELAAPMGTIVRHTARIGDTRWKVVMLFWYGKTYAENQAKCPRTTALLQSLPQVHAAMFSILPPGKEIPVHRGPFRGALRYHLGLKIPRDRANCYINVDGVNYHWEEGVGQIFDDTYVHYVRNDTDEIRIVLFLDVERPLDSRWATWVNQALIHSPLPAWLTILNNKQEKTQDIVQR